MDPAHSVRKMTPPKIDDLTADVLALAFSMLRGRDIARCTQVCRYFAEVIDSDLYLQYKIELALNGMVDGGSSILPTSERVQRLRRYVSNFERGVFDHEDLSAHPDHIIGVRNLQWNIRAPAESSLTDLYSHGGRSNISLSVFTPGSALAGIQSHRYLLPIRTASRPGRVISKWAIDHAQDLLVIAEIADTVMPEDVRVNLDEVYIHFYSLSGSKIVWSTPHPAAARPEVHVFGGLTGVQHNTQQMTIVIELHIGGQYVISQLSVTRAPGEPRAVFIEVYRWRTGERISRAYVGTQLVHVVPLEDPYLLVIPNVSQAAPCLSIYSFSPSDTPTQRMCTLSLQCEDLHRDDRIRSHAVCTGDRPQPPEGHFHVDLSSHSVVALTLWIGDPQGDYETHFLLPRTTLLARIRAAAAEHPPAEMDGDESQGVHVPWEDWGPQVCLRLRIPCTLSRRALLVPLGSRMPLVVFDGPNARSASVFVFDVDPLSAHRRSRRGQGLAAHHPEGDDSNANAGDSEPGSTAVIDDIEAVLPGVVDPECARIPYVAYRFKLPYDPAQIQFGHSIRSVVMNMTGFTAKFTGVAYEGTVQTWTV